LLGVQGGAADNVLRVPELDGFMLPSTLARDLQKRIDEPLDARQLGYEKLSLGRRLC
jgi:hypothetical protein